jgi:hypothetical protein
VCSVLEFFWAGKIKKGTSHSNQARKNSRDAGAVRTRGSQFSTSMSAQQFLDTLSRHGLDEVCTLHAVCKDALKYCSTDFELHIVLSKVSIPYFASLVAIFSANSLYNSFSTEGITQLESFIEVDIAMKFKIAPIGII